MPLSDDDLITHATVRDMCGRVTGKTLRRWGKTLAFPVPVLINNRLYWRRKEVSDWLRGRKTSLAA